MKFFAVILGFSFVMTPSWAQKPKLDPFLTARDYERMMQKRLTRGSSLEGLEEVLAMGKRFLGWIDFINQNNVQKISLSSEASMPAFPINTPRKNNAKIVLGRYNDLLPKLPLRFKEILVDQKNYTKDLGMTEKEFYEFGRQINDIYELANRWILEVPYLKEYTEEVKNDVRPYYYLSQEKNLKQTLQDFGNLKPDAQSRLQNAFMGLCQLYDSQNASCENNFKDGLKNVQELVDYYKKLEPQGQKHWQSFFKITEPRTDIVWDKAHPEVLTQPFIDPKNPVVSDYLKVNIEDEWKWKGWQLKLKFVEPGFLPLHIHPYLAYADGTTPHVSNDAFGESYITMDANVPLTEYDVRWTIRHEFGHILGFPDCYVEFYEPQEGVMINYQLDITNIMCSRRGHLQEGHYLELKKTYLK